MFLFKPNVEKIAKRMDTKKLIKCLHHKDKRVRSEALTALSLMGSDDALEALIVTLRNVHNDGDLRERVLEKLVGLKDRRTIWPILEGMAFGNVPRMSPNIFSYIDPNWVSAVSSKHAVHSLVKSLTAEGGNKDIAVWALGEIKDPVAVEPLIELLKYKDNNWLVDEIVESLEKLPNALNNTVGAELLRIISTRTPTEPVVRVLKKIKLDSCAVAQLISALFLYYEDCAGHRDECRYNEDSYKDTIPETLYQILENIDPCWRTSKIAKDVALSLLVTLTGQAESGGKVAASELLAEMNDSRAIKPLIDLLNNNRGSENKWFAIDLREIVEKNYLNSNEAKQCVPTLIDALSKECYKDVRCIIAEVLLEIVEKNYLDSNEAKQYVPTLIDALLSEEYNEDVKCIIAKLLGEIGAPNAVDALISCLGGRRSSYYSIYTDAYESGGYAPSTRGAIGALCKIGYPAVEPLIAIVKMRNEDKDGHKGVQYGLNPSDYEKWHLQHLKEDAITILACLKDPRAVEPLIELIKGHSLPLYNEEAAALNALVEITGENFATDVLKWQDWWKKTKNGFATEG